MLDLAIGADHGGLAVGLDAGGTADSGGQALDHHRAEVGAVGLDLRLEVVDEATAQPRVLDHHGQTDHGHRLLGGLAAFDEGLFHVADDLADFEAHWALLVGEVSCCLMVYHNIEYARGRCREGRGHGDGRSRGKGMRWKYGYCGEKAGEIVEYRITSFH
ncbi:hypothetical protein D3C81_1439510 [compost metagenome]